MLNVIETAMPMKNHCCIAIVAMTPWQRYPIKYQILSIWDLKWRRWEGVREVSSAPVREVIKTTGEK